MTACNRPAPSPSPSPLPLSPCSIEVLGPGWPLTQHCPCSLHAAILGAIQSLTPSRLGLHLISGQRPSQEGDPTKNSSPSSSFVLKAVSKTKPKRFSAQHPKLQNKMQPPGEAAGRQRVWSLKHNTGARVGLIQEQRFPSTCPFLM